ncbi:MAG TPA: hypothetical protein VL354_08355 [Spirochaetia bacterium]|nr:hypothetical protein [Spirochaetia bacterium]
MGHKDAISDLLLEQYVLGEVSAEVGAEIREELARDPSLMARYQAILSSDAEILERYPSQDMAKAINDKLEGERNNGRKNVGMASALEPAGRWALQLAVGLPAAAVVLLVFSFFIFRERLAPDVIRVKGLEPHMNAFLMTQQGVRELGAGSLVGRGDVIRLSYTAADARYGVILSVDGRGTVTWHMPSGSPGPDRESPALDRQGQIPLPVEYELDDAPGFERFFFVYSDKPFNAAVAADAVRSLLSRLGSAEKLDLTLPAGIKQFSLLLKKRSPVS